MSLYDVTEVLFDELLYMAEHVSNPETPFESVKNIAARCAALGVCDEETLEELRQGVQDTALRRIRGEAWRPILPTR